MSKKLKVLLTCLAALSLMGVAAACETEEVPETSSSSTSSSVPAESSPEESSPEEPEVKMYTVKFVDYDDRVIFEKEYEEGATVEKPADPERESANGYAYTFAGWDSIVANTATENVTYKATYSQEAIEYKVVFKADGVQVGEELKYTVENKEIAVPAVPAKAGYNGVWETYALNGGDVEVNAVYTAIEYKVVFLDEDGSVISEKADCHYGDAVEAPSAPEKASTTVYEFTFAGWDKETVAVTEDATYIATYTAALKAGFNANEVSAAAGESIVLNQSGIGGGANYTLGQQNDDGDETPSFVKQSYLAIDGDYNLNDYVAFDFTGKNMPEVAFFAKNYNDSMYAEGTTKQGIVVVTGITTWDGQFGSGVNENGTKINYGFPYMIQDAADGGFCDGAFAESALGRANLVDGTHYRVIMGFTGSDSAITLNWYLYNLDTNTVVEQSSMTTWNFFTGSNTKVGNMKISDLNGSIVLYGKFGTTCTIDKLHGVYENTNINDLAAGLNEGKSYTVTFKDANGNELKKVENLNFGASISYDEALPTPDKAEDALFTYSYAWDKEFAPVYSDAVYTLKLVATAKSGYKASNVIAQGEGFVLGAGGIGDGANYSLGQNNGGYVNQAYLGIDGNYGLNNYVVFDFTGKNMPEVAFFAKNYNNSMYAEGTSKQGIVVVTGITTWDGQLGSGVNSNGTQINYGFPYMIQDAANGGFCDGAFANSALGRANLVDGTHYRVIMGFTEHAESAKITLKWCLYNLDTKTVVEESSMSAWGFFTGSNAQVGNMTRDQLSGSIVLYGKFGTTCTIDKLYDVESGTFSDVVTEYKA